MRKYRHPNMFRVTFFRFLMTSAALVLAGPSAFADTITDTIRTALETNPEIGVVKNDRHAVAQELRQARAQYLPSIDLRAAAGPEVTSNDFTRRRGPNTTDTSEQFGRQVQLRLSQILFDGFERRSELERQRSRVDSASYRVLEATEFIAVDAVEAHLEVLRNREIVRLNEANVEAHRGLLDQVRRLERQGATGIADVRQAEARMANAEATLAQAVGSLNDAIAFYQRVVGERPGDLSEPVPPVDALPDSIEKAAEVASFQSPTVLIAAADVEAAAAELRGARSGFYPRLDFELTGSADNDTEGVDGRELSASALVVLRYNLYRGGADVAREREAFHRLNEARSRLLQARRAAEEEARVSLNAYEVARERTQRLRDQAEAQRRTRDAYASQFEIGQRDLLDLLDAENELFLSRVQLTTAQYTEQFAVYRALGVIGSLLETLDLAHPRETINIHRRPADVLTPEAINEKSLQLHDPKAEPRPLRGEDAGEPPTGARDAATVINRPPQEREEQPTALTPQRSSEAPTPAAKPVVAAKPGGTPSYDSLASFWKAMTGGAPEAAPAEAPRELAADPAPEAPASTAAPPAERRQASYDSFASFWKALTGRAN